MKTVLICAGLFAVINAAYVVEFDKPKDAVPNNIPKKNYGFKEIKRDKPFGIR